MLPEDVAWGELGEANVARGVGAGLWEGLGGCVGLWERRVGPVVVAMGRGRKWGRWVGWLWRWGRGWRLRRRPRGGEGRTICGWERGLLGRCGDWLFATAGVGG